MSTDIPNLANQKKNKQVVINNHTSKFNEVINNIDLQLLQYKLITCKYNECVFKMLLSMASDNCFMLMAKAELSMHLQYYHKEYT